MRTAGVPAALFASVAMAGSLCAHAEAMRCGIHVVNESETVAGLLNKCGEPQRKEVIEQDVRALNPAGRSIKVGTEIIEHWWYQKSSRALPMKVTIVGGSIKKIERASD